jgi:hypothetical protein
LVEDRDRHDGLEHIGRPADVHRARHALPDAGILNQDEGQLVGEVRTSLGAVDLVAAEVRERAAVDLEHDALDAIELRQREHDLRKAPHGDRGCLLRDEGAVEIHRGDAVVDREAVESCAGVDRGPEVRRTLRGGGSVQQCFERPGADGGGERLRPMRDEE